MKIQLLLSSIALSGLLATGCHDDDAAYVPITPTPQTFDGGWNLIEVSGGIAGTHDAYVFGEITWTFDAAAGTVHIDNYNSDPDKIDLFETGDYTVTYPTNTVTPQNCATSLAVDGISLGCYSFTDNEAQVSQIETDGYLVRLVKEPIIVPFKK